MDKSFMSSISIEKFAAFLDGNLQPNEMQQISSLVKNDKMMHDIFNASNVADETMANYTTEDLALPEEITSLVFELPSFDQEYLWREIHDDYAVAACADVTDLSVSGEDIDFGESSTDDISVVDDSTNDILSNENNYAPLQDEGDLLSDSNDF